MIVLHGRDMTFSANSIRPHLALTKLVSSQILLIPEPISWKEYYFHQMIKSRPFLCFLMKRCSIYMWLFKSYCCCAKVLPFNKSMSFVAKSGDHLIQVKLSKDLLIYFFEKKVTLLWWFFNWKWSIFRRRYSIL